MLGVLNCNTNPDVWSLLQNLGEGRPNMYFLVNQMGEGGAVLSNNIPNNEGFVRSMLFGVYAAKC